MAFSYSISDVADVDQLWKGRVFVSDNGRIATFDTDGVRLPGSVFDGLAAGPLLKVARSYSALDPERSRRKGWRN